MITLVCAIQLFVSGTLALEAPTNLVAVPTGRAGVHLSWDAVPGASFYQIFVAGPSSTAAATAAAATAATQDNRRPPRECRP